MQTGRGLSFRVHAPYVLAWVSVYDRSAVRLILVYHVKQARLFLAFRTSRFPLT